jgi:hypothetical protein
MRWFLFFIFFFFCGNGLYGQVSFDIYADDGLTISSVHPLDFGLLLRAEGERFIGLGDADMVVVEITGVEHYHIVVTIMAGDVLKQVDGPGTMPFTLQAAYANQGRDNISEAVLITGGQGRFPILRDDSGIRPEPVAEGRNQPSATAYLYLYGSINAKNAPPGEYTGNVNIFVTYD